MPESLADWYAGFLARREARTRGMHRPEPEVFPEVAGMLQCLEDEKTLQAAEEDTHLAEEAAGEAHKIREAKEERRLARDALPRCKVCKVHTVSQGITGSLLRARECGMCMRCYGKSGIGAERIRAERLAKIEEYGLCRSCKVSPVSTGEGYVSTSARKAKLCYKCFVDARADFLGGKCLSPELAEVSGLLVRETYRTHEVYESSLPRCNVCNVRAVSQGESVPCERAAKLGMCIRCYQTSGTAGKIKEEERCIAIEERGLCVVCKRCPVSGGKSRAAIFAQKQQMCWRCYNSMHQKQKKAAASIKEKGPCVKCRLRAIAEGKNRTSRRIAAMKLCWQCYGEK